MQHSNFRASPETQMSALTSVHVFLDVRTLTKSDYALIAAFPSPSHHTSLLLLPLCCSRLVTSEKLTTRECTVRRYRSRRESWQDTLRMERLHTKEIDVPNL